MQRPRRTSEFHEEPGTATKRSSRQTQRSTCIQSPAAQPGTAQKYNTRQSRIARPTSSDRFLGLPLSSTSKQQLHRGPSPAAKPSTAQKYSRQTRIARPTSADRFQSLPLSSSALRAGRPTPQKTTTLTTPLHRLPATRVLFTAEKPRHTMGVPLHSDKKWVNEQTQYITEYLRDAAGHGSIAGLSAEFLSRPGCLRQISIKQFVAIINYFLRFICRFTVGANHVDDIVNILQKLHYPHQVNKSWLKTPNTQHSFGNVIVLLDFLIDLVPPCNEEQAAEMQFPFQEPSHELNASNMCGGHELSMIDAEFQAHLLRHSEEGFKLWDQQLMEEYSSLEKQTCDMIIQKRCGVQGMAELDVELEQLQQRLHEVQKKRPSICAENEEQRQQLNEELKQTLQQLDTVRAELKMSSKQLQQLQSKQESCIEKSTYLEYEVAQLKTEFQQRIFTPEQRDELIEKLAQLKHIQQSLDRAICDLKDRDHHQQILLSCTKKQLNDLIEAFNAHMREITYSQLHAANYDELQLPLIVEPKDLQLPIQLLKELSDKARSQIEWHAKEQETIEQQINAIAYEIESVIEVKTNSLRVALTTAQKSMHHLEEASKKERQQYDNKLEELEENLLLQQQEIGNLELLNAQQQQELNAFKQEIEQKMSTLEDEYNAYADTREENLNKHATELEQANAELEELKLIVEQNEKLIKKHKNKGAIQHH